MSDSAPPAAGWYADPENPAGERWWNGSGWSDHKRASTADAGFTFGATAAGQPGRPDPYAAASAAPAAPTASPYAPSPYSPAPYGAPAYGSGTNGLAVAGLIVSAAGWLVLSFLGPIAGIILSAFGLAQAKRREAAGNPNSGRGMAMAGLIVGIALAVIGLVIVVAYVGFMISLTNSSMYY